MNTKTLLMTTAAALFAAGAAYAENAASDMLGTIDADGDGVISTEEWDAYNTGNDAMYSAWDADGDGMLSQEEYEVGVQTQDSADNFSTWKEGYGGWDTSGDGMLSADEYRAGAWTTYDADGDGSWSMAEAEAWQNDATRRGFEVSQ